MRVGIVAHNATDTNLALAAATPLGASAFVVPPDRAVRELSPGDLALGRLDVRPTVDGVEDGLWQLDLLRTRGVTVLNPPRALELAHDKLLSAAVLSSAALPHPRTVSVRAATKQPPLPYPFVLKPRFGSWGRDVMLCADAPAWTRALRVLSRRPWFARCGAVAQELVPPLGHDVRVLVAGGEVIGSVKRVAAPGEWRTNIALGARREPFDPNPVARELAVSAAHALGADLVGVDLLPLAPGRYVVIEVNGAVDFTYEYALDGDPFELAMSALVDTPALAVA